jgi:hypothetical protein
VPSRERPPSKHFIHHRDKPVPGAQERYHIVGYAHSALLFSKQAAAAGPEPLAPKEMIVDFFETVHSSASNALLNIQKQLMQYQGQVSEAEIRDFLGQTFSSSVNQSQEEFCLEYAISVQVRLTLAS